MSEEAVTATEESASPETPLSPAAEITDFREYAKWRTTGELPAKPEEPQPAAAADEQPPQAKSEPQSGADDTQHEEEEEDDGEGAGKRRGSSRQRKIDRLTRENEQLKQQLAAAQPKSEPPKADAPGKPKLEQFQTLEEYQEALTDWKIGEREKKREAEAQEKAAREAQEKLQTEWDSKQKAARKAHQDYDDAIESVAAPDGPGVAAARQAMLEDENGAEILYHLATHPDELKRIASFTPIGAVREIGKLSAFLSPPSTANGKQRLSAAPKPPPRTTRPSGAVSDSIDDPAVQADFRRWSKARAAK